jgi:hypothetical protein
LPSSWKRSSWLHTPHGYGPATSGSYLVGGRLVTFSETNSGKTLGMRFYLEWHKRLPRCNFVAGESSESLMGSDVIIGTISEIRAIAVSCCPNTNTSRKMGKTELALEPHCKSVNTRISKAKVVLAIFSYRTYRDSSSIRHVRYFKRNVIDIIVRLKFGR